jgi:hypothetical protein
MTLGRRQLVAVRGASGEAASRRPAIYRRAAECLFDIKQDAIRGCCFAIAQADGSGDYTSQNQKSFHDLFEPDDHGDGYYFEQISTDQPVRRECRLLALCLMAAMVEAGDA